jgi:hypothetical protein
VDLSASGWTVRQGQAVWRRQAHAPEIAGELLVATHADGSTFVQFAKNPLPFVTAQTTTNRWRVEFIPQHRTWAGNGDPPQKIVWLHLAPCLSGDTSASGCWHFQRLPGGNWRMENPPSGEFLEGFLNP